MVLITWLAAFLAAALLEYAPHASLWFPPAAISFAAILVLGLRVLPVLWLACLIATVFTDRVYDGGLGAQDLLISGLVFAFTHTLSFGIVAVMLRRRAFHASPITTLRKVVLFLLWGAFAAGLSAVLGATGLAVTGMIDLAAVPGLIAPWWIGDYAGLITLAPLAGLFLTRLADSLGLATPQGLRRLLPHEPWRALFPRAVLKLVLLLSFSLLVLAAAAVFPDKESLLFLLFVSLILQLWIVHTESELAALLGIIAFSFLLAFGAGLMGLAGQALMLQFVVISVAASSYLGLAVPALYRDNDRLRQMLTHDPLTGALARSFFQDAACDAIRQSVQNGEPACLVMVDLDGLKPINDQHGHAVGDIALKVVARACAQNLGPGQFLGRLSGDEFAMFLSNSSLAEANRVVKAVQSGLAAGPPLVNSENARASFGVATLDPARADFRDLLVRADQAMYRAKRG
jgi:diguanylate cyclase (GGDEF)-like protein